MKAEKKIVPFPGGARQRDRDELDVSAGRAGDRRNPALAHRSGDRRDHHRPVRACARLGEPGPCGHRGHRHRKDRSDRPQQGDPALRDRRGARHPGRGRPDRQRRRCADRARSHHQPRRDRSSARRPAVRPARHRPPARGAHRHRRSARRLPAAGGRRPGAGRHAAPVSGGPDRGAQGENRRARRPEGPEAGRARHHRGHHRQARGGHSDHPGARQHPQDAQRIRLAAAIFRGAAATDREPEGTTGAAEPLSRSRGRARRHHRHADADRGRVSPHAVRRADRGRAQSRRSRRRPVEGAGAHQAAALDRAGVRHGPATGRSYGRRRGDARPRPCW